MAQINKMGTKTHTHLCIPNAHFHTNNLNLMIHQCQCHHRWSFGLIDDLVWLVWVMTCNTHTRYTHTHIQMPLRVYQEVSGLQPLASVTSAFNLLVDLLPPPSCWISVIISSSIHSRQNLDKGSWVALVPRPEAKEHSLKYGVSQSSKL